MSKLAAIVIGLIAVLHLYIAWFEIFAWTTRGPVVFSSFPVDLFEPTKAMAANQGIYNSFLAAGLIWSLFIKDTLWRRNVATCFLLFVAVAGLFGAVTVAPRIAVVQTLPAVVGLVLVWLSWGRKG
ncbi:putative membrane protein [Parasphingorhabdus marina DSM 22363]|uniref:Putative membrane protein n=1 Tax=Parasphingorhabdus marina DSM 22363 TaxID=1123272 RepID=A0A1N6D708_9SPHN|nr:DUF1304 domain-containing protein [Parasphingorhabdus marina]SIN66545.1 putative membrane protein [Parasphingorhabdus marina DSM 22363]